MITSQLIKAPLCIDAVHMFVCLSPKSVHKKTIFSKTKQFTAMTSIDDL